jgi:hypothetical protein
MRFKEDNFTIEIFSETIDEFTRKLNFKLEKVVGVSPHFVKFVFIAILNGEDVEIEATYGHNNTLDQVYITYSEQEDLFYEHLSSEDFEKVIIN